jgi:hypothetical protein
MSGCSKDEKDVGKKLKPDGGNNKKLVGFHNFSIDEKKLGL